MAIWLLAYAIKSYHIISNSVYSLLSLKLTVGGVGLERHARRAVRHEVRQHGGGGGRHAERTMAVPEAANDVWHVDVRHFG